MAIPALVIGILGFAFCTAFRGSVDELFFRTWRYIIDRIRRLSAEPGRKPDDLAIVGRLIASTRAGISLDSAMESATRELALPGAAKIRIAGILEGRPGRDFLSTFLDGALRSGLPVLGTLQAFQKVLQSERKVKLKARALTSQSRAQAEALSWLPWILFGAISLIDSEWFLLAWRSEYSWMCWGVALLLLGIGRRWMRSLLNRALLPSGKEEILKEELLPDLTLRLLAQLSLGKDAESALECCLKEAGDCRLEEELCGRSSAIESAETLRGILSHGARTGAPLRDDLLAYLTDLYLQLESRWEERVQRLPVVMMGPLFLCFFPSSLLMLGALLLPLAKELL